MSYTKTFICLASSDKHKGICMAGREWRDNQAGSWLRVTGPDDSCLLDEYCLYENGETPQVLDVIEVDLLNPCENPIQPENWEIQPHTRMRFIYRIPAKVELLEKLLEPSSFQDLWIFGLGNNDRVISSNINKANDSLRFISLSSVVLFKDRRSVKGSFEHNNEKYCLTVTDPIKKRKIFKERYMEYGKCFATISLTNEFINDYTGEKAHYKLIAALLEFEN